jgi:hypothetical protein
MITRSCKCSNQGENLSNPWQEMYRSDDMSITTSMEVIKRFCGCNLMIHQKSTPSGSQELRNDSFPLGV